jgi:lipopolysaccharide heptosyltransferase I
MRVLVVKLSSLGDVIHTLPALTDAARAIPGIEFDWAVEEAFAEIPAWHPAVDRVIPVAMRRWRGRFFRDFNKTEWDSARAALQALPYDAVIDAQGLLKSALIAGLVKAPSYGMGWRSARERLASAAYDHRIYVPKNMHAVERTRLLFGQALDYSPPTISADYGLGDSLPAARGPGPEVPVRLLFFHGSAREEKLWPEDHWVELAGLAAQSGYTVGLPWGNAPERARAERIAARADNTRVLPYMNLNQLAGMLRGVDAAVAVDTGLAHLSAALAVPTVSLYGPTNTRLIGAYGRNQAHIQSPLGLADTADPQAMMASIGAPAVWKQLQATLPGED